MSPDLNDPHHPWSRLTAAARRANDDRPTEAPYGFATRVAALAFAQERRAITLLERFALRAVGLAALLALGSVVLNYRAITSESVGGSTVQMEELDVVPADDAVAIVLALAD